MSPLEHVRTDVLEVAYLETGPPDGPAAVLLHGYPYDVHSYVDVGPRLAEHGYRVIVPYLRSHGPTRFLDGGTTAPRWTGRPSRSTTPTTSTWCCTRTGTGSDRLREHRSTPSWSGSWRAGRGAQPAPGGSRCLRRRSRRRHPSGGLDTLGQGRTDVLPGSDSQLGEHFPQVPLDRVCADEELGADLGVREAGGGEPGDLGLLRRELGAGLRRRTFGGHAGRGELAPGTLGVRPR